MPSVGHESLVDMFRECPPLAADLLTEVFGVRLPPWTRTVVGDSNLSQLASPIFHADLVLRFEREGRPTFGLIIEPQTRRDQSKRYTWPVYAGVLRARWRCPTAVLVVALDEAVARWAGAPIQLGPSSIFTPMVLGPEAIPRMEAPEEAARRPEKAVLSLLAHRHALYAPGVFAEAIGAVAAVDMDRARIYTELVLRTLDTVARRTLEVLMGAERYEGFVFRSEWAREHIEEGVEKGVEKGRQALIRALTLQLRLRFPETPVDVEALTEGAPLEVLERHLGRVLTAARVEDVFVDEATG